MKNTTRRFTRKMAAMVAAVTAMSAFAVSASASDAENNEIIEAAKANAALQETWEDIENNDNNEDELDQVYDLMERLNITVDCYNGNDKNEYENSDGKLTHEQVMDVIRNANPDGCIKNPFNMDFGMYGFVDDDDDEPAFSEEDFENAGDEDDEDDGESCFDLDLNFGTDFIDQLFG